MKNLQIFLLILLLAVVAGCSGSNSDAPVIGGDAPPAPHPTNWISLHGAQANADLRGCQGCHGFDFKGAGTAVSCFKCHSSGPPFVGAHPASWNSDPLNSHQQNFQGTLPDKTPWTTCANGACHGTNLQGSSGPSCMDNTASCHATSTNGGWPNAPHVSYTSPTVHGPAAKGVTNPSLSMGNYCLLCHGTQPNTFDGGFVALYYAGKGNCSACHPDAKAHPTNWVSTRAGNNVFHNDGNISANPNIKTDSCALCHTTTGQSPSSPFPGAPTCFNATFNGLNCHAAGPGGAPHDTLATTGIDYLLPENHGLAAKADPSSTSGLVYCQGCHATAGGPGSNPRFNVPKGSMINGCEDCHVAGAHPTGTDRWTFNYDGVASTRRTHFATGNSINTVCVLCHNVTPSNIGGTAPACNTCHASTTSFSLNCTFCHETPPVTGTPNLTSATLVDHAVGTDVTTISNHENCSICHGASEDGTSGVLAAKPTTADYVIFTGTGQGGNHLDGLIEVNTDVGYQDATAPVGQQFGCSIACHPNDAKHQMPNSSGLPTSYGAYTAGTVSCTDCHGYPPNGISAAPGALSAVNHLRLDGSGNNILLINHGECQTCHGTKETSPGSGTQAPIGDYVPATMHYNGFINMNGQTGYDETNHTCNTAVCHDNQAPHILTDSGLPVQLGNYGAGSCSTCHGYPPGPGDTVDHTAFVDSGAKLLAQHGECQTCHGAKESSPGSGTLATIGTYTASNHRNGLIEMNLDAQYQTSTVGCALACHANASPYVLPNNSGMTVNLISLGISGNCTSCHGNPPIVNTFGGPNGLDNSVGTGSANAGKHDFHVNTKGYGCDTCHNNYTMPNGGNVSIGYNIVLGSTTDTTGTYNGRSGGSYSSSSTGTSVTTNGALTCSAIYCHGTATPQWLDTASAVCGSCHGDTNGMPSTTLGDGDLSGAVSGKKVGKHASHVITQSFACSVCHNGAGSGTANHVNGTNDIVFDTTLAGASAAYNAGSSTCSNLTCHGNAVWDTASTGGCDFCHGYPPNSINNKHASGFTPVNHDKFSATGVVDNHDQCSYCHGVRDSGTGTQLAMATTVLGGSYTYVTATDHIDGKITMNGDTNFNPSDDAGYDPGTAGCDTGVCHGNDLSHELNSGGAASVQKRDLGPGQCSSCHFAGNTVGAPAVTGSSTHVKTTNAVGATYGDCTDCHSGHVGSGGVTIELPSNNWTNATGETHVNGNMQTALGIDYTTHNGINLGGPGTVTSINTKSTEAEICWGCHDANGIGELASGGGATYKFGNLSTSITGGTHVSDWTTPNAWRQDAYDARLSRPIASVHTVNMNGTTGHSSSVANNVVSGKVKRGSLTMPGNASGQNDPSPVILENKQDIRCSYCHDVHSLNKAPGDTGTAAPYLRGTWLSDPYPEDHPPTVNQNYGTATADVYNSQQTNGMPRAKSTSVQPGGFFIDQNSGSPTNGLNVAGTAGLCILCHGTNINTMDYYTGLRMWTGTGTHNGHSNSALGGAGTDKINLFDATRGGSYYMAMQGSPNLGVKLFSPPTPWSSKISGSKPQSTRNSGWYGGSVGTKIRGGDYTAWYSTSGIGSHTGTANGKAHDFTCSKCHSPHATGLPALLKTNCLDTGLANYTNSSRTAVNYNAAQSNNCHRKTATETGWNTLAPKQ